MLNVKTLGKMMPMRRKMSTGTKLMLVAIPVVTFMVGKMIGTYMNSDDDQM